MFPEVNYILSALIALPAESQIYIANAARPASSYLFGQILPERGRPTYDASSGNMTVHAIMAGLAGLSSNYPPGGFITASTTSEKTAKVANHVELNEEDLRTLQMMVQNARAGGATDVALITDILNLVLNFYNKMVLQPHLDTAEFLRGLALGEGKIDWWNNGIHLQANYHIPAGNIGPNRTGTAAYGGSASTFWDDILFLQDVLLNNVSQIIMHPYTLRVALANIANGIEIIEHTNNTFLIRRIRVSPAGFERISTDSREIVQITTYGLEASKIDDTNPKNSLGVPFIRRGRVIGIGVPASDPFDIGQFAVGQGSTPDPTNFLPLGYTHIAPTVEGGGRIGRWGRVYVPQEKQWSVAGEGVTNIIPVIQAPKQVATCFSDLPGAPA